MIKNISRRGDANKKKSTNGLNGVENGQTRVRRKAQKGTPT